jgi:hypothetical protein
VPEAVVAVPVARAVVHDVRAARACHVPHSHTRPSQSTYLIKRSSL